MSLIETNRVNSSPVNFHHSNPTYGEASVKASTDTCVEVYAPDTKTLYSVPRCSISHMGSTDGQQSGKPSRALVCRSYCNAIEEGQAPGDVTACAMGKQCRFVHIDVPLSSTKGEVIHIHYVYRDESLSIYDRLSTVIERESPEMSQEAVSAIALMIYGPNNREPVERIPATCLLLTGGSRYAYECATNPRRNVNGQPADQPRVCHCAHYYFTQTCNRGVNCSFIHVVSVDPQQKADSSKPVNYRRRVTQLGQVEVPHMGGMSPQTNYHSAQNTPLTAQHSVPVRPSNGSAYHISHPPTPHTGLNPYPVIGGRRGGNASNQNVLMNVSMAASGGMGQSNGESGNGGAFVNSSTSNNSNMSSPALARVNTHTGHSSALNPESNRIDFTMPMSSPTTTMKTITTASTPATVSQCPPIPSPINPQAAPFRPVSLSVGGVMLNGGAPIPPPPAILDVCNHTSNVGMRASPPTPLGGSRLPNGYSTGPQNNNLNNMLPMDDVVDSEETAYVANDYNAHPASGYTTTASCQGNFSLGANGGVDSYYNTNYNYSGGGVPSSYSTSGNNFHQRGGATPEPTMYISSNRASPAGTPSTAMHRIGTPKVSAGRYAHNPYAQSPVTAQAQV